MEYSMWATSGSDFGIFCLIYGPHLQSFHRTGIFGDFGSILTDLSHFCPFFLPVLEWLWALEAPFWSILAQSWQFFLPVLGVFSSLGRHILAFFAQFWPFFTCFWVILGDFGPWKPHFGYFGLNFDHFWSIYGRFRALEVPFSAHFLPVFGLFWVWDAIFQVILGPETLFRPFFWWFQA